MKSADLTEIAVSALEELKARQIVTLDVSPLSNVMDTLIIASGTSSRHVKSLADNVAMQFKKLGSPALGVEGADVGDWVLVDLGDVVVHVMLPEARDFYDLEGLWTTPLGGGSSEE